MTDGSVCGILGGVMEKEDNRRHGSTACRSVYMNVDTGEKTWLTPKYIVDALGPFDLDPCCPDGGMPWTTAKRMVTKSEDGLSVDWTGCRVWMNPPYGRESAPFFEKMAHHVSGGGSGIAFVFARTDTAVWHDLVFPNARALLFLRGCVRFFRRDGSVGDSAPTPSVLIGFSDYDSERLREASDMGAIKGYYVRTLK